MFDWFFKSNLTRDVFFLFFFRANCDVSSHCNCFSISEAFDTELLLSCMEHLKRGQAVSIPNYDFKTHQAIEPARKVIQSESQLTRFPALLLILIKQLQVNPPDIIILEGILVLHDPRVRDLMSMKIFVDTGYLYLFALIVEQFDVGSWNKLSSHWVDSDVRLFVCVSHSMTSYPITIITVPPVQILMYAFLGEFNVILLKEAEISRMCLTRLVQLSPFRFLSFWMLIEVLLRIWNYLWQLVGCNLQYARFVKPSFEEFILPSKKYADIIIPRGGDNDVAIDLIVQHIHTKLGQHELCKIYPNIVVIHSTFQVTFTTL